MSKGIVLSLYDYTGEAVRPWADAGYECYCFDIQHDDSLVYMAGNGGIIFFERADLHKRATIAEILNRFKDKDVVFGMGFPVCTDLAVSGARHFKAKAQKDPWFQHKAAGYARWCAELFEGLGVPYFIENPVSVLASLWRKPDHIFHPWHYGGYIPEDQAEHPKWPEYIAPRDAYQKKTCLWTGGNFKMPERIPVECSAYYGDGYSKPMMKLGGKSMKTKNIRSATPRGFAKAVFEANN